MRVTLLTIGSRGDVQPMLALGRELADGGHEVRMATHRRFESLAARAGLPFAQIAEGRLSEGPDTPEGRRWMETESRYLPTWFGYVQDARSVVRERLADALVACADSDAIIASDLGTLLAWQMAEHYGVPLVRVSLNLPARASSWHGAVPTAVRRAMWRAARVWLDAARKDVGLPALPSEDPIRELDRLRTPVLRAYSPAVGALPASGRDWIHVTGYWFLEERLDPEPPSELADFIAAGSPPVCIDFGSMFDSDPRQTVRLATEALARAGRRGILIRGRHLQSDVELPATIFAVDAAPHDWLFAQCSAVVHHAGAGTTAAALRAGVPSVPVPHTVDQMRWARRIHEFGVASAPTWRRRLSASDLSTALAAAIDDPRMSRSAAALRETVASEDGTARAREILEGHLGRARESARLKVAV